MKKILLIMVLTFMSVAQVNASTSVSGPIEAGITVAPNSCSNNLFKYDYTNVTFSNGYWNILDETELTTNSSRYNANNYFIELKQNTTYYFYTFLSSPNGKLYFFKDDFTLSKEKQSINATSNKSFIIPTDTKYVLFTHYTFPSLSLTYNNKFMISEIEGLKEFVAYEECAIEPDKPNEEIIPDTTLTDFYSLFTDRLTFLSKYALENKFILSAICILLSFICLELLIYLFKGGRR